MWLHNPAKDTFKDILKELKTRIKAEKQEVKRLEPPVGHWTFAAVAEAFKRRVHLDQVCSDGFCSASGKAAVER